jgi:predicted HTH domain antitoxin
LSVTLSVELPEDVRAGLQAAGYTWEQFSEEVQKHVALLLFARDALSLGQAAAVAGMPLRDFIPFLGENGIPVAKYDAAEIDQELDTAQWLASRRKR